MESLIDRHNRALIARELAIGSSPCVDTRRRAGISLNGELSNEEGAPCVENRALSSNGPVGCE